MKLCDEQCSVVYVLHFDFNRTLRNILILNVTVSNNRVGNVSTAVPQTLRKFIQVKQCVKHVTVQISGVHISSCLFYINKDTLSVIL